MKIADALSGVTRLFLDTAPVIFFVERHLQDYPHVSVKAPWPPSVMPTRRSRIRQNSGWDSYWIETPPNSGEFGYAEGRGPAPLDRYRIMETPLIASDPVIARHIIKTSGVCGGRACIAGHRIRVMDIVVLHEKRGMPAAGIRDEFPGISLADIHAALAYYFDNTENRERVSEG